MFVLAIVPVLAQEQPGGVDSGNYHYQGAVDLGFRFVDTNGARNVYNTYVNQQQGFRFFEQTLGVRSLNHSGALFDNLFVTTYGWGGDPENGSRVRLSKNKFYNFNFSFRRDQNYWDYSLLANPLNPANTVVPVNNSPHLFNTRRRMYDFNLTVMPQSRVRFRFGYTRNRAVGPSFSSVHEGTDTGLFQDWSTTLNAYQFGIDFRLLPRTSLSYDQFLQYYEGDTTWLDNTFNFQLAGGIPVDSGLAWNLAANQPCAAPLLATVPPTYNPACNGYFAYSRVTPQRVSYPTEQLTLQSSYFRNLDLSGRFSYSASDAKAKGFDEAFAGLITRTRGRTQHLTGDAKARRVAANVDLGATVHLTHKLRIVDTFRFSNFRIPGFHTLLTATTFGATLLSTPNSFSPATCPPPFTAATCPQHNASSTADVIADQMSTFLQHDMKVNTVAVEYDVNRFLSAHVGYRYENRRIVHNFDDVSDQTFYPSLPNRGACAGLPLDANGVCTTIVTDSEENTIPIHGHAGLFGVSIRPADSLRFNFDTEFFSADRVSTRISPRQLQQYRLRGSYKPAAWFNLSGTVNIRESRNNVTDVFHKEHNRNYGFALALNPKPRFALDAGYNYNDVFSNTNICYVATPAPPGSTSCGTPFLSGISVYTNRVNFAYANFMVKPVKRVVVNTGYNLTSTAGETLLLDPTQGGLGPLAFNYHKPFASVGIDLSKNWTWNAAWNYFGYNEKSSPGPISPRDFHSNQTKISLRYAF